MSTAAAGSGQPTAGTGMAAGKTALRTPLASGLPVPNPAALNRLGELTALWIGKQRSKAHPDRLPA